MSKAPKGNMWKKAMLSQSLRGKKRSKETRTTYHLSGNLQCYSLRYEDKQQVTSTVDFCLAPSTSWFYVICKLRSCERPLVAADRTSRITDTKVHHFVFHTFVFCIWSLRWNPLDLKLNVISKPFSLNTISPQVFFECDFGKRGNTPLGL